METSQEKSKSPYTVEWHDLPERYIFDTDKIAEYWDLAENGGIVQIFDVDTRWFNISRWTGLINNEIDGSHAAVEERDSGYLLVVYSTSLDGAEYIRKRVDGALVAELRNISLTEYLMDECGDVSYFGRGKAESIAEHFESLEDLRNASVSELQEVESIGKEMAKNIHKALHS